MNAETENDEENMIDDQEYDKDEEIGDQEMVVKDGGWGWVVCLTSCLTNGSVFGIINTFGIVYEDVEREFTSPGEANRSFRTAMVWSIATACVFGMSPIVGLFIDQFGIRPIALLGAVLATGGLLLSSFMPSVSYLYVTFGVMLGAGCSLLYNPSLLILGHYFKRYLGRVNGIVALGSGLFTIAMPYLLTFCTDRWGVRNTLRALGGMMSLSFLYAFSWKPTLPRRKATNAGENIPFCKKLCSEIFNREIWKNRPYVIWLLGSTIALFGYFVAFVHLSNFLKTTRPSYDGRILIICLSVASSVGRIISGRVVDIPSVNKLLMFQCSFAVMGLVTSMIPIVANFYVLIGIVLIMGLCDGCIVCLIGPIVFHLVEHSGTTQALGFFMGFISIPFTTGPLLAGALYDHIKTYSLAFHLAGIPALLGAIVMFLIPRNISKNGQSPF